MEIESAAPSESSGVDSIDVDSLVSELNTPSPGIPMSEPEAPAPAPQPAPENFEFTANGKQIKANRDQVLKYASQGYNYAQVMQEFKRQQEEFQSKFKPYQEIDEFARQNPEWWSNVQKAWDSRTTQQQQQALQSDPNNPILQKLSAYEEKLSKLEQLAQSYQADKQNQIRQTEDEQLNKEIQSMREQYKHLDWNSIDDSGYTLEQRVVAYGVENGLRKFDQAFKLYNHDRLLSLAEERGKEQVGKDIQKRTKLGLLGTSPTPKQTVKHEYDKSKSYDQLYQEALDELGIKSS